MAEVAIEKCRGSTAEVAIEKCSANFENQSATYQNQGNILEK